MYHYVRPDTPGPNRGVIGLTPEAFERQLDDLLATLEPIDWPQFLAAGEGRTTLPPRCFLLTFDDGLSDHVRYAAPAMARRSVRGVFFVATEPLTRPRMLPAHAMHLLIDHLGAARLREVVDDYVRVHTRDLEHLLAVSAEDALAVYHYETEERATLKYLLNMLMPVPVRRRMMDALFAQHVGDHAASARDFYLGWDDLVSLQSAGHTIGGHGHTHDPLALLEPGPMKSDVCRCTSILNEGLGFDRRPISYPFGSVNEAVRGAARGAGFAQGFTTIAEWATPAGDAFAVPRIDAARVAEELEDRRPCPPPLSTR